MTSSGTPRPGSRHRPGERYRQDPDDGLDEPRGPGADPRDRSCGLLVALPAQALAQGRGVRAPAGGLGLRLDCDADVVLLEVEQKGGIACHTGRHNCFFRELRWHRLGRQWTRCSRIPRPSTAAGGHERCPGRAGRGPGGPQGRGPGVFVCGPLVRQGARRHPQEDRRGGHRDGDGRQGRGARIVHEVADLWFHTLVLLAHQGLGPDLVLAELERRFGLSGLEEKASRGR